MNQNLDDLEKQHRLDSRERFDRLWDKLKSLIPLYLAYPLAMVYIYEKSIDSSAYEYNFPLSVISSLVSVTLLLVAAVIILQQSESAPSKYFIGSYHFALSALVGSSIFIFLSYLSLVCAFIEFL